MGFSMFSGQNSPIAIDFGSSSVKLLQIEPGEQPKLLAAVGLRVPDSIRSERDQQIDFLERQLPRMLRKGRFRGRRAICSVPSRDTFIQHIQIAAVDGVDLDELVQTQLQTQPGWPPFGMVIRTYEVAEVRREGETLTEVICVAMGRDTVMRYVQLLKACKLEAVGVHSEVMALLHAFKHFQANEDADLTTMYVDIGWGSTKVAISHGEKISFARSIQIGGHHFDQQLADRLGCDVPSARAQRISEQVLTAGDTPAAEGASVGVATEGDEAPGGDLNDFADALAEELAMCLRYHQSLFHGRRIDRVVFLGGEARDTGLCQQVARTLRLPAQLGDPLTRLECKKSLRTPGLDLSQPQPGWAVVCGLCTAPTDL